MISQEQHKDIKVIIKRDSSFATKLTKYGFITIEETLKNNIPLNVLYKEDEILDVITKLIECSPLKNLDDYKKDTLKSKLYEIPSNSLFHSNSDQGVLYSGYYLKGHDFYFSIYDIGIGIPNSVRKHLNNENLSSRDALSWAFKEGNTTKITDYPRGVGFTLLEEFRKEVKGKILLITEDIYYEAKNKYNKFNFLPNSVRGTLFTFKISV
ncbi:MAG: hypothetical protein RR578_01825 [Bacilli bacterium]